MARPLKARRRDLNDERVSLQSGWQRTLPCPRPVPPAIGAKLIKKCCFLNEFEPASAPVIGLTAAQKTDMNLGLLTPRP